MVFVGVAPGLGRCVRPVELPDQLRKAVWYPLAHHVIIHGAKLVADSGLDLGIETALLFYFLHDLIHASPSVKSLYFKYFPRNLDLETPPRHSGLMRRPLESSETAEHLLELSRPPGVVEVNRGTGSPRFG